MKIRFGAFLLAVVILLCPSCTHDKKQHYIGEKYLGAKYIFDPLGEGKAPDKDPLIRTDAFDCMSFVETALAGEDVEKLNKIRYKDGKVDILTRNHFMEVDWMKNNQDIVENVSSEFGKTETKNVIIDKQNWFKKNYNMKTDFEKELAEIEYIPYKNLPEIHVTEPMIVLFLCDGKGFYERIGSDLTIIHMGFLLPGDILRHASSKYGIVMDADFNKYIAKNKKNKHHIGIALVKIK